jgi:predicted nucleic acid-binding protein
MDGVETALEEIVKSVKRKDIIATILIATALFLFGMIALTLLDIVKVPQVGKGPVVVGILVAIWIMSAGGMYLMVTHPMPELYFKLAADLSGILWLSRTGLLSHEVVYISESTFKKIPPRVGVRMKLEVVRVPKVLVEELKNRYEVNDEELAEAMATASYIKAKYLVTERKHINKLGSVKIVKPDEFVKNLISNHYIY